jgi:hypothetical protein
MNLLDQKAYSKQSYQISHMKQSYQISHMM